MEQQDIYKHRAEDYDALVSAEDCDGNLLPAVESIHPLAGASVLDVGAGTGRIARILVGRAARVLGVDREEAMLSVARRHLQRSGQQTWELKVADARALPVATGWADLAVAGWVFGHFRYWLPLDWRAKVAQALAEMRRAVRPGGTIVVIETLGTGNEQPAPPSPELGEYYRWLEETHSMKLESIRTDYLFPDVQTAARITGFFFGETFAAQVRDRGWSRVPECTGLWWARR